MPCTRFRELWGEAPDECFSVGTVVEENKRKLTIEAVKKTSAPKICKISVDGCLINQSDTKKCDFAFFVKDSEKVIFVECKGQAVAHGVDQLIATFKLFRDRFLLNPNKDRKKVLSGSGTIGIIVASKVSIPGNKLKLVKDKYKKHVGGKLIISSGKLILKV